MDCSLPGSSILGILQARILEWVAMSSPRGSSQPRDWTQVSLIAGRFLPSEPPGKHKLDDITPLLNILHWNKIPHTFNKIQLSTGAYQSPSGSGLFDLISFPSLYCLPCSFLPEHSSLKYLHCFFPQFIQGSFQMWPPPSGLPWPPNPKPHFVTPCPLTLL